MFEVQRHEDIQSDEAGALLRSHLGRSAKAAAKS